MLSTVLLCSFGVFFKNQVSVLLFLFKNVVKESKSFLSGQWAPVRTRVCVCMCVHVRAHMHGEGHQSSLTSDSFVPSPLRPLTSSREPYHLHTGVPLAQVSQATRSQRDVPPVPRRGRAAEAARSSPHASATTFPGTGGGKDTDLGGGKPLDQDAVGTHVTSLG